MFGAETYKGKFVRSSLLKQIEGLKKGRLNRATKEKEKLSPPQDKRINSVTTCELDQSYVSDADGDKVQGVVREEQTLSVEESARNKWRVGRRVVELGTLADGLKGCKLCGQPLQLSSCEGEQKYGLAHVLLIRCNFSDCGVLNEVPTGSKHKAGNGRTMWDVNTKLAVGSVHFVILLTFLFTYEQIGLY